MMTVAGRKFEFASQQVYLYIYVILYMFLVTWMVFVDDLDGFC